MKGTEGMLPEDVVWANRCQELCDFAASYLDSVIVMVAMPKTRKHPDSVGICTVDGGAEGLDGESLENELGLFFKVMAWLHDPNRPHNPKLDP